MRQYVSLFTFRDLYIYVTVTPGAHWPCFSCNFVTDVLTIVSFCRRVVRFTSCRARRLACPDVTCSRRPGPGSWWSAGGLPTAAGQLSATQATTLYVHTTATHALDTTRDTPLTVGSHH